MVNGVAGVYDGWDEWERKSKQPFTFDLMGSKVLHMPKIFDRILKEPHDWIYVFRNKYLESNHKIIRIIL